MQPISRRDALKLVAAGSVFLIDQHQDKKLPQYITQDAEIKFHCTTDYPIRWKQIYQNTLDHFSKKYGRVGPTHVFLIENDDWEETKNDPEKIASLKASQKELRRTFTKLHGQDSDGEHLEWKTGNLWSSWSLDPPNLVATMSMSPYRDGDQFVVGSIHEYVHAIQIAYGYAQEAIDSNRMGQALWTGPAWFREGSAVMIAALYAFQHPELFKKLKGPFSWRKFSGQLNRNLGLYQKAKTSIRQGVTHNDWQRLEPRELVYPVIYCGGSIACATLFKKVGSLENFMKFFRLVPKLGWQKAFEQHFKMELANFYNQFEREAAAATAQQDLENPEKSWFEFLKSMKESN